MRGKWVLAAAALVLLGAAAGAVSLLFRSHSTPEKPAQLQPAQPVGNQQTSQVSLTGTVRAQSAIGVPAPIEGTIEEILVSVDEEVHKDQVLGHIKNLTLEAEVAEAQEEAKQAEELVNRRESEFLAARLEASRAVADLSRVQAEFYKAEKTAQREGMLHREGATPRLKYEQSQADFRAKEKESETAREVAKTAEDRVGVAQQELDAARARLTEMNAELESANSDLLASEVLCPVDGVITAISAKAGEEVHPEKGDLFQIATDLSKMEVLVESNAVAVGGVKVGQIAQVHVAEAPNESLSGVVRTAEGGTVIVEFASPSALVRPGLSAQVVIQIR